MRGSEKGEKENNRHEKLYQKQRNLRSKGITIVLTGFQRTGWEYYVELVSRFMQYGITQHVYVGRVAQSMSAVLALAFLA